MKTSLLHMGTCSWKYDSWEGLVYSCRKPASYLQEYGQHFNTVEVDQWFWSLFAGDKAVLPKPAVVREYAAQVPRGFTFCVKVPNSITLSHHYKKSKSAPLQVNPHFLSGELFMRFLDSLEPLHTNLGPLIFQFEYFNKQKMSGDTEFYDRFEEFAKRLPRDFSYFIELRNPNWLNTKYFYFLNSNGLYHVFLQGYYMPSIFELYRNNRGQIQGKTLIRLHGPDRKGIEEQTGKDWSRVVAPKDQEIETLGSMIADLQSRQIEQYIYVNNHYEGCAPRTLEKIKTSLVSQEAVSDTPVAVSC